MARKKTESNIENTYTEEIEYICPKRGRVTQKVKIKRYRSADSVYLAEEPEDSLMEELEE